MTVAELIARLQTIEDQSLPVFRADYEFNHVEIADFETGVKDVSYFNRGSKFGEMTREKVDGVFLD